METLNSMSALVARFKSLLANKVTEKPVILFVIGGKEEGQGADSFD